MMYIKKKPKEPSYFAKEVREKGEKWQKENPGYQYKKLPSYWTKCIPDLHKDHKGICAYYCFYIDLPSGTCTIDHFHPKSNPNYQNMVYDWSNYRFACLSANRNKNVHEDILDPFLITTSGTFILNLVNGEIGINYNSYPKLKMLAENTIKRLKLDDPNLSQKRADDFLAYIERKISEKYLKEKSPFVWSEAKRQNLI
ncbi:hypothetical protein [Neisseria sp. 74A18]|uniref:hypothetical protein n=1 Tax=Neisseria sp. 74A18 TaxID=1696094 RepID=UPI0006CAF417|nr:hypothetical protein [Neisseria sp. 74A18]